MFFKFKIKNNSAILSLAFISVTFSGCATIDSLHQGRGGETFDVKGKGYNEIWISAEKCASYNLTIVEDNKTDGNLRAEKGVGMATWGEVVGIFVRPVTLGADKYTIEVQSLKRHRMQITGQDWTTTIMSCMKAELGI